MKTEPDINQMVAAFPIMLDALRKAKAWIEVELEDGCFDEHDQQAIEWTMEAINAAIQKATQP